MIPVKLKLQGFLSYREPVELDFTGFNLACISGENGAGKSSLLDAITWALFGRARKADESVINTHPAVKQAEVTLDFDYEGNRYRVVRTNPRGKTSSVDFFIRAQGEDEQWNTLSERTLRETDAVIVDTLRMDYDTFTNASFFLQGKADQFATARPGDRKQILSNILGLGIWETYREAAAQRRRDTDKQVKGLEGRLSEIQAELDDEPRRTALLAELQEKLADLTARTQERARAYENVQKLQTALSGQKKLVETLQNQLESAEKTLERNRDTLAERQREQKENAEILARAEAIEKAYADWQAARESLEAMDELAEQFRKHEALRHEPVAAIRAEAARLTQELESLTAQQIALEAAEKDSAALDTELAAAKAQVEALKGRLAERQQLDDAIRQLQAEQAEAKAENPRLKTAGLELGERISKLEAVEEAECPLCGQPLSDNLRDALIQDLSKQLEEMRESYRLNLEILKTFTERQQEFGSQLADLKGVEAELREATRHADQLSHQLSMLEAQRTQWDQTGAARLAEIEENLKEETFAEEARQKLATIDAELAALGYDLEAHRRLRQVEQAGREADAELRALEKARAALEPVEREITGLKKQLAEQEDDFNQLQADHTQAAATYAAAQADLPDSKEAERALLDSQEQENLLRREVGAAEQLVNVLDTLRERKAALTGEREALNRRIADLRQLERAFGKDGIPALLIEQALPEIEETTNELLSRLSNGRMSFRFETQREYKDNKREDMKETLDLIISDGLGKRDYEMFSGGEAFRVNFSIRLALSKLLARRAGARLQTLVIDEGFGSQDAQGRQRLVEAISTVRDDFAKILVITHLEELKDAFSTRIEVTKTDKGSQVLVV